MLPWRQHAGWLAELPTPTAGAFPSRVCQTASLAQPLRRRVGLSLLVLQAPLSPTNPPRPQPRPHSKAQRKLHAPARSLPPSLTRPLGVKLVQRVHRQQLHAVAQLDGGVDLAPHHQLNAAQRPLAVPARRAQGGQRRVRRQAGPESGDAGKQGGRGCSGPSHTRGRWAAQGACAASHGYLEVHRGLCPSTSLREEQASLKLPTPARPVARSLVARVGVAVHLGGGRAQAVPLAAGRQHLLSEGLVHRGGLHAQRLRGRAERAQQPRASVAGSWPGL